jgi:hypothetical protein
MVNSRHGVLPLRRRLRWHIVNFSTTASLSLSDATFGLAALTLLVAATSLYFARFRAGRIVLRHVPTHLEWATGGGVNEVPDLYRVTLRLAASNPGAHPCVLERVVVDAVEAIGSPELATSTEKGQITGAAGTAVLSTVVDPGSSRQIEFQFELEGVVSTAAHTTPTPDLGPMASMLGGLQKLAIVIRGEYQRTTRRQQPKARSATVTVELPVNQARQHAAEFWQGQGREDLAALVVDGG